MGSSSALASFMPYRLSSSSSFLTLL